MVTKIQCYEDTKGKLHRDPLSAHRSDLTIWLKSSGAISDPSAKILVDWLTATHDTLDAAIEALQLIRQEMPAQQLTASMPR